MGQNFRPKLEVGGGFKDRLARRVDDDGVACVHETVGEVSRDAR